jgi:hypothetical protein
MPAQTSYQNVPDVAVVGQLDQAHDSDVKSMYNGDVVDVPFARAVKRASLTDRDSAALPSLVGDLIAGVTLRAHVYENGPNGELSTTGVKPAGPMNVAREGRIWVICEDGCNVGDRLWIRFGGGTQGALRATDAGGGTCSDHTKQGEWQTFAAAGAGAWLECDFDNKA